MDGLLVDLLSKIYRTGVTVDKHDRTWAYMEHTQSISVQRFI